MTTDPLLSSILQNSELAHLMTDAQELTPAELKLEHKAAIEELKKRTWLHDTAQDLVSRIPVSIFAMGVLAAAG